MKGKKGPVKRRKSREAEKTADAKDTVKRQVEPRLRRLVETVFSSPPPMSPPQTRWKSLLVSNSNPRHLSFNLSSHSVFRTDKSGRTLGAPVANAAWQRQSASRWHLKGR